MLNPQYPLDKVSKSLKFQDTSTLKCINVDMFEFEDTLRQPKTSVNLCEDSEGYALTFPDGQSPHNSYPFALHSQLELPWNYSVRNGQMILFA